MDCRRPQHCSPCMKPSFPFLVSEKKNAAQLKLMGQGPYQSQNIDVRLNTRVERIDPTAQQVYTAARRIRRALEDVAVTFDPITGEPVITGLWTNAGVYRAVIQQRLAVSGLKNAYINHRLHWGHLMIH